MDSLRQDSIRDFATVEQLYRTFLDTLLALCPQCGRRRERHSWRTRWVVWAPGRWDRLALLRVRCRACHTVETCFPPWLVPYEPAATWLLVTLSNAVAMQGQTWAQLEREGAWPRHWLRRHVGRWLAQAALWRTLIAQQWLRWGWPWPAWTQTWQPPTGTRLADWAWVQVAWAWTGDMLAVSTSAALLDLAALWLAVAPQAWPPALVPAATHWGRRLRRSALPP